MNSNNGHGKDRILSLNPPVAKTDAHGRVLLPNAKVEEVYQIVAEESAKIHEHYLNQIPPHVARMIQDALMAYGLIKFTEDVAASLTPAVPETAPLDPSDPDSVTPPEPAA